MSPEEQKLRQSNELAAGSSKSDMIRSFKFWLWVVIGFQILTAIFHTIGIVVTPGIRNETERQLYDLMTNYRIDAGGGFTPSMSNLVTALSSCFTLLCVFGALINLFLLRKNAPAEIVSGILLINILIFGVCFALMAVFTFLPPIVMTGLIFVSLLIAAIVHRFSTRPIEQEHAPQNK